MSLHIYHPNKTVSGFASSFTYSAKNRAVFASIVKQASWDEAEKTGSFKESLKDNQKFVNIKLSDIEVSAILDCIERSREFKTFHDSDESPKSINFSLWNGPDGNQKGYSFSVTVGSKNDSKYKNSFYIGLTFAEARCIREYLVWALHNRFNILSSPNTESPTKKLAGF